MKQLHTLGPVVAAILVTTACTQQAVEPAAPRAAAESPALGSIERADPKLDAILAPDARLELLGEHFGVTEGPVWVQDRDNGYLLFSDMAGNVVYKRTSDGQTSVFLEKSGYTGDDILNAGAQSTSGRLAVILIGSNGLTLDPDGRLVIAAMADRSIARIEKDGTRTVLAERFDGKRFNGPNDLVVKSNGAVYFTDFPGGMRGREKSPAREMPFFAVYLVKDGKVIPVEKYAGNTNPNGIALSTDEKELYVGAEGKIFRYDIRPDDTLANGRLFIDSGTDGMKVDRAGNVYTTSGGSVKIFGPDGKPLGSIVLPKVLGVSPTNVAFGDADNKGLYITARTHLFRIRLQTPGIRPGPK
jgi:gluconolactonase